MSKCGDFSGPYFPVFSPNTGKYRPEKTPYLDTFHAVNMLFCVIIWEAKMKPKFIFVKTSVWSIFVSISYPLLFKTFTDLEQILEIKKNFD